MNKAPPLFKHQTATKKALKNATRFFDQSEPGTGKTRVQIEDFAERRARGGKPGLVLATRSTLESAWADDFQKYAPNIKVAVAYASNREKAFAQSADVYITNHDAVNWLVKQGKAFWKIFEGGTLIVDECFPARTLVDTPDGPTPIEMLECGTLVHTTSGALPITRIFKRESTDLVVLEFDDGTKINCTEDHPFATENGWMEARRTRGMQVLQLDIHQLNQQGPDLLRAQLQSQSDVGQQNSDRTQSNIGQDGIKIIGSTLMEQGPSAINRNQTEDQCSTQSIGAQAEDSRWQWTNSSMRTDASGDASTILDCPVRSANEVATHQRVPDSLQTGLCTTVQEVGLGGRRQLAHSAQTLRCEERFLSGYARVVRVSRDKRTSPCVVYNIQVDGPHNYSVAGKLVHNCTAFKHNTSQRSKNLAKITKHFEWRRMMSGLADPNGITDLWHQYFLLDEGKRLGKSFFGFRSAVCIPEQVGPMPNMVKWVEREGVANIVAALIKDITIKHLFKECVDIPPNHEYTRAVKLVGKHAKHYCEMQDEMVTMAKGKVLTAVNKAVLRTKLLQIASGAVYNSEESGYTRFDTDRYELVLDLVQECAHSVVFFQWSHQRDELVKEAEKRGLNFAVFDGKTSDKERASITENFQKGAYDCIFAHPKSAAHGLTWVKGTRTIWASPVDNLEWYAQGLKRIYRIGQKEKTETITIVAADTYDEIAWERLTGKVIRSNEFTTRLKEYLL